jgi:hypothetical protein
VASRIGSPTGEVEVPATSREDELFGSAGAGGDVDLRAAAVGSACCVCPVANGSYC